MRRQNEATKLHHVRRVWGGLDGAPADIVNQKGEPRLVRAEKPHWSGWACPGDDTRWEAS